MSHLPLDARAILHYLNELGYTNISAAQLKEFLKGMQPQSDNNSKSKFKININQQQQQPNQQQQQQQQSHLQQQLPSTPSTTTTAATAIIPSNQRSIVLNTPAQQQQQKQQQQRSPSIKVIKCKKPLCNFKFYIDVCDQQITKRIEDQIKFLGGSLEFFLTESVTHFITDKPVLPPSIHIPKHTNSNNNSSNNSYPETPRTSITTPGYATPETPHSVGSQQDNKTKNGLNHNHHHTAATTTRQQTRQSRADAILSRARQNQSANNYETVNIEQTVTTRPLKQQQNSSNNPSTLPSYVVWQVEHALRFFKKVQHELQDYLGLPRKHTIKTSGCAGAKEPISLKSSFIKIESIKRNCRPYYQLFKKPNEWPKIQLSREDGAFRLSPKREQQPKEAVNVKLTKERPLDINMTRKSRSRSSQQALKKSSANSQRNAGAACRQQQQTQQQKQQQQQKESSDKQCGVCEICKIEYDTLTIHLKTKDHEYFARNAQNFIALDTLIHTSADVNKFLQENRKIKIKSEAEEEHVPEELDHADADADIGDKTMPDADIVIDVNANNGSNRIKKKSTSRTDRQATVTKTPSPSLREKSKRSTKGKHSSEKFQNIVKSPKTTTTTPLKSAVISRTTAAAVAAATAAATLHQTTSESTAVNKNRKKASLTVISPPLRATLPTSSLYKVVETHTNVNCTTPRAGGGGGARTGRNETGAAAVASPSIIVKFKKVRSTELQVLNGEAENFMFPKRRTDSSDLPTDVDRQTTSDRINNTATSSLNSSSTPSSSSSSPPSSSSVSSSLSSSSHVDSNECKKMTEGGEEMRNASLIQAAAAAGKERKTTSITAKRKTTNSAGLILLPTKKIPNMNKQSFPMAPIQPGQQQQLKLSAPLTQKKFTTITTKTITTTTKVPMAAKGQISLPEATRKSSRTATAIVTAATTSNRLLQAAVEAAKNKNRNKTAAATATAKTTQEPTPKKLKKMEVSVARNKDFIDKLTESQKRVFRRNVVVKLEDRMGEQTVMRRRQLPAPHRDEEEDDEEEEEIDFDDYDDATVDNDDTKDEDFVIETKKKTRTKAKRNKSTTSLLLNSSTRDERAMRRQNRLMTHIKTEPLSEPEIEPEPVHQPAKQQKILRKDTKLMKIPKKTKKSHRGKKLQKKPQQQQPRGSRFFDFTKSERLQNSRYAFERLPETDLWYRVYTRQDGCEERYFEYFGTNTYRKLPYELGPMPLQLTLPAATRETTCCPLCEKTEVKEKEKIVKVSGKETLETGGQEVNLENEEIRMKPAVGVAVAVANSDRAAGSSNTVIDSTTANAAPSEHCKAPSQYTHKHKKLHLLQRYRQDQEQQELLQRQQQQQEPTPLEKTRNDVPSQTVNTVIGLGQLREHRTLSINSNASSYTSSSTMTAHKTRKIRNKHLNKAAFLAHLELPPRKSPREHASTLALVSCIIKQRQDSMSKPNSETDEPPTTPITPMPAEKKPPQSTFPMSSNENPSTSNYLQTSAIERLQTPGKGEEEENGNEKEENENEEEEEDCPRFATEISETVKRMRRGRNKYDYSPPFLARKQSRRRGGGTRGRGAANCVASALWGRRLQNAPPTTLHKSQTSSLQSPVVVKKRRGGAQKGCNAVNNSTTVPSIRKTGSKKGVLEFEVDDTALHVLKSAISDTVPSPQQLEWQIDKYLTFAGQQYDLDTVPLEEKSSLNPCEAGEPVITIAAKQSNTPPPTDYFSSDFDLYDLLNHKTMPEGGGGGGTTAPGQLREGGCEKNDNLGKRDDARCNKEFSLFNTPALHHYFRRRKTLKSNRTGWPKPTKKKINPSRQQQQQQLQQKIYFLKNNSIKQELRQMDDVTQIKTKSVAVTKQNRAVITPPDSGTEMPERIRSEQATNGQTFPIINGNDDNVVPKDKSHMLIEDEDDADTVADSMDDDADADADIEEVGEDDDEEDEEEEDVKETKRRSTLVIKSLHNTHHQSGELYETHYEPPEKRIRCMELLSPVEKIRTIGGNLPSSNATHAAACSSTPTNHLMRALRRTPQLNGSLGSCISPSEKAGDNSDIFTVSSDGLETDLDLSNSHTHSHSQLKGADDESRLPHHQQQQQHYHNNHNNNNQQYCHETTHQANVNNNASGNGGSITPKRKFDLSKYAPTNGATCAAEAATAAVKSLAISQFLKKEVRVTCRRLRAPFRRFRYRR